MTDDADQPPVGISIHAPLAGRDENDPEYAEGGFYISIHAPLAGRDRLLSLSISTGETFQSTRPLRGATVVQQRHVPHLVCHFNPRAPCGARQRVTVTVPAAAGISNHAPLAGRDRPALQHRLGDARISIHAPLAGRDGRVSGGVDQREHISIHAPLAGRDHQRRPGEQEPAISIHAPLAGRDSGAVTLGAPLQRFQSTRPLRGATSITMYSDPIDKFQSTRPLRGATNSVEILMLH